MDIDEKFIKSLRVHVKPESLVDEKIWQEWFEALRGTDSYGKKIYKLAQSKQMAWPLSNAEDTVGNYLDNKFSTVKKMLGWEAKRTLDRKSVV